MKKFHIASIMSVLLAFSAMAQITCNAAFNVTPDPSSSLMYNFQPQSTSTGAVVGSGYFYRTKFYFGDGTSRWDSIYVGWQGGFSHYYNSPGIYALMLEQEVVDSANGNVLCTSYAYDTITIATAVACAADFSSYQASSGSATISFQNNSYNSTSPMFNRFYSWDFGDGNSSTAFSPSHTYGSGANYQVTLFTYALDTNGVDTLCSSSKSRMVDPGKTDSCSMGFIWNQQASTLKVDFTDYSFSYAVDTNQANALSSQHNWDFGDGAVSTQKNPEHTYATLGAYTVTLFVTVMDTVQQSVFCQDTVARIVNLTYPNPSCNAAFGLDSVNSGNGNVNIYNYSTPAINDPNLIVNYSWDFDDGTTSNQPFPSHTFQTGGPYNVCLTVSAVDSLNYSCTDTYCVRIGFDSLGNVIYKNSGFTLNVLDPSATVGEKEYKMLDVKVYPNPASNFVNVEGLKEGAEWNLYNIQGAQIENGYLELSESKIDFGSQKSGLYILSLKSGNTLKSIKLSIK